MLGHLRFNSRPVIQCQLHGHLSAKELHCLCPSPLPQHSCIVLRTEKCFLYLVICQSMGCTSSRYILSSFPMQQRSCLNAFANCETTQHSHDARLGLLQPQRQWLSHGASTRRRCSELHNMVAGGAVRTNAGLNGDSTEVGDLVSAQRS